MGNVFLYNLHCILKGCRGEMKPEVGRERAIESGRLNASNANRADKHDKPSNAGQHTTFYSTFWISNYLHKFNNALFNYWYVLNQKVASSLPHRTEQTINENEKKMLKQSVKNKSSRLIRTNVKLFICSLSVRVVEYHLRSLLEPLRSNRSIQIQCKQDNRVHNWNFDTKTAIGIFFSGPMLPPLCFFIIAAKNSNGIFSLRPQNINIHINALQHISDKFFSGQTYSKFYIFTVLSQTIHGGISQWTCINFSNYISLIFLHFFDLLLDVLLK